MHAKGPSDSASAGARQRRVGRLLSATGILVISAVVLLLSVDRSDTERRFAGLWHFRAVFLTMGFVWGAVILVADAFSRPLSLRLFGLTLIGGLTLTLVELVGWVGLVDYDRLLGGAQGEILGSKPLPNVDITGSTWEDTAAAWGLPAKPMPFRYKTDHRGFRNEHDRDSADVYLLGDSCLVGALLPFEQTLCARLETELARPVMNVALIAIGVQEERDQFRQARLDVRDRLVLQFVFEGNDQSDSANYRARAEPANPPGQRRGTTFTWNCMMLVQKWLEPVEPVARRRTGYIRGEPYTFFWTAAQFRGRESEIPHILAALEDTRRLVEQGGGRFGVVVIPDKIRVLGGLCSWPPESELLDWRAHCSPLPDVLIGWGREAGVPLLDLTPSLFASAKAARIPWWPADTHWNETGHEVVARAIEEWIGIDRRLNPK